MGRPVVVSPETFCSPLRQHARFLPQREIRRHLVQPSHLYTRRGSPATVHGRRWQELRHLGSRNLQASAIFREPRHPLLQRPQRSAQAGPQVPVARLQVVLRRQVRCSAEPGPVHLCVRAAPHEPARQDGHQARGRHGFRVGSCHAPERRRQAVRAALLLLDSRDR